MAGGPLGGDELLFRLEAVDERGVDVVAVGVALQTHRDKSPRILECRNSIIVSRGWLMHQI